MVDAPVTTTPKSAQIVKAASSIAAQTSASLASLLLAIVIARSVSQAELGVFSLISTTIVVLLGVARSLSTELIVFRDTGAEAAFCDRLYDGGTSASVIMGSASGAVIAGAAIFVDQYSGALLVAGAVAPLAILQDHCRFVLVHQRRSQIALGLDLSFFAIQALGLVLVSRSDELTVLLLPWLVASALASAVGLWLCRARVNVALGLRWIRITWRSGRVYLADFLTTNGVSQCATFVVSIFGGAAAAGALRGAQILLSPLQLVLRGGLVALGSEVSLLARGAKYRTLFWVCFGYSLAGALGSAAIVAALILVPDRLSAALLGDSADAALAVLPFAGAASAALCVAMGAGLALRAVGRIGRVVRVKLVVAPFGLLCVVLGSWVAGAAGSQAALAIAESGRAAGSWREFVRWNKETQR